MLIGLSMLLVSASLDFIAAKSRLGKEKARSRQIGASSALMSLGFFGLLRNLRSAARTGPDLDGLFTKLGCSRCFEYNSASDRGATATNFDAK